MLLKQSSSSYPLVFFMVSSTDHVTGLTGATCTVTLSKNGGAFASPSGTVTEIANGWYKIAGNSTDSGTLGPLLVHATASGADPTDMLFEVVAFDPQVGTNLGLSALPSANPGASSGVFIAGTNAATTVTTSLTTTFTGNLTGSVGSVTGAVGSVTGAVGSVTGNVSGSVASVTGAVASVTGAVGSVTGNVSGSVGSVTGGVTVTTNNDKTGYALTSAGIDSILTRQLTESYNTKGTAPTVAQAIFMIQQSIGDFSITGTTLTAKKLDGTTAAATYTLDSSTAPTSRTRAT